LRKILSKVIEDEPTLQKMPIDVYKVFQKIAEQFEDP
jgi:hypothetical protein